MSAYASGSRSWRKSEKFAGSPLCGVAVSSRRWSRRITEQLAEGIPRGLPGRRGPGHPVGLVHDHEVPVNLLEAGEDVCVRLARSSEVMT